MTPDQRAANLKGLGTSRKRVEDMRFTQARADRAAFPAEMMARLIGRAG